MEILLLLIPLSLVLLGIAIRAFLWAVDHHQFDDLERHAIEALQDESE